MQVFNLHVALAFPSAKAFVQVTALVNHVQLVVNLAAPWWADAIEEN